MVKVTANGLQLEVLEEGPGDGIPLVHISGIFSQLVRWDQSYFTAMADRGLRMIRYDNRDVGLSEKLPQLGRPDVMELIRRNLAGEPIEDAPYDLHDMAADCIGVLDALDIDTAHIQGESMGGMIAQIVAASYPDRVRSLISVMSSSSRSHLPPAPPEGQAVLLSRPQDPDDRDGVIAHNSKSRAAISGSAFNPGPDYHREKTIESYDRGHYPESSPRHLAAGFASRDREDLIKSISAPTLVIHGTEDIIIPHSHSEDLASLIPQAELHIIKGMNHSVEPTLAPLLAEKIGSFIDRVEAGN